MYRLLILKHRRRATSLDDRRFATKHRRADPPYTKMFLVSWSPSGTSATEHELKWLREPRKKGVRKTMPVPLWWILLKLLTVSECSGFLTRRETIERAIRRWVTFGAYVCFIERVLAYCYIGPLTRVQNIGCIRDYSCQCSLNGLAMLALVRKPTRNIIYNINSIQSFSWKIKYNEYGVRITVFRGSHHFLVVRGIY